MAIRSDPRSVLYIHQPSLCRTHRPGACGDVNGVGDVSREGKREPSVGDDGGAWEAAAYTPVAPPAAPAPTAPLLVAAALACACAGQHVADDGEVGEAGAAGGARCSGALGGGGACSLPTPITPTGCTAWMAASIIAACAVGGGWLGAQGPALHAPAEELAAIVAEGAGEGGHVPMKRRRAVAP